MAPQGTVEDGRAAQFREMMDRFDEIKTKYAGVRGELLAKVREELMRLEPGRAPEKAAAPAKVTPPAKVAPAKAAAAKPGVAEILPSCRACGRTMKATGDGSLVCQNGHTRQLAG